MPEADSETSLTRRDEAWFNSRILAGDKSGVAGVELTTASEPPARQPRIWWRRPSGVGRRPQPPLGCDLRLNHASPAGEREPEVPSPEGVIANSTVLGLRPALEHEAGYLWRAAVAIRMLAGQALAHVQERRSRAEEPPVES